jgi:hypothetical protein
MTQVPNHLVSRSAFAIDIETYTPAVPGAEYDAQESGDAAGVAE